MFKKQIAAAVLIIGLVGSSSVFAGTQNVGVGLGSVLLKGQKGKVMEVLAVTLNMVSANSLFAITFGTLGYKEGVEIGMTASDTFIAENMDALASDIAKGEGEYIDTLAFLMHVSDTEAFKSMVQDNFDSIYTSPDVTSVEVSARIKTLLG
jgi:hypothetical protein